jgi:hypothetical protein
VAGGIRGRECLDIDPDGRGTIRVVLVTAIDFADNGAGACLDGLLAELADGFADHLAAIDSKEVEARCGNDTVALCVGFASGATLGRIVNCSHVSFQNINIQMSLRASICPQKSLVY